MGNALLIIGLSTSWLGIAPVIYNMAIVVMPPFAAYCFCVAACGLFSTVVDFPLSGIVPALCEKLFDPEKSKVTAYQILILLSAVILLSYCTMTVSSYGGKVTKEILLAGQKPKSYSVGTIALDSTLQVRGTDIKKAAAEDLKAAEVKDKAIQAEAVKKMVNAKFLAVQKFPNWELHPYHRNGYNKIVDKARIDSTNKAAEARNLQEENERLNIKLAATNTAFMEEIEGKKLALSKEWESFNTTSFAADLLLSWSGWTATPIFILMVFSVFALAIPKKGKGATVTINTARSFQDATKHITQQLARLKEAIENASATSTYATNILGIYDEVETAYPAEFTAMQIRHSNVYSIFKRKDVEMYI
jgi:hypothetical protein